jgi:tetraacyldisaccharide 4'-kinase
VLRARVHDWVVASWDDSRPGLLLAPAERLFAAVVATRNGAYDRGLLAAERAAIPVVSVGNLTVGGVGKTPIAAWIARRLLGWGLGPAVVLRGYGADEVLVHQELNPEVPVYAAKRRAVGVALAAADGCRAAVLDDGFQHRALARDLDVVVVSADRWTGRTRLLPRGPWREGIGALARAGAVIVTRKAVSREESEKVAEHLRRSAGGAIISTCRMAITRLAPLHPGLPAAPPEWIGGRAVLAVTSLGDPRAFHEQLERLGARVEPMTFPDHHHFATADAGRIAAGAAGRVIVMTRKEAVKLRPLLSPSANARVAEQEVAFETGEGELLDRIRQAVSR